MGLTTTTTYRACSDCLMAASGVTEEEQGRPFPTDPAPLSYLYADGAPRPEAVFSTGLEMDFSVYPCEACGSPLAGDRHGLVALYRA